MDCWSCSGEGGVDRSGRPEAPFMASRSDFMEEASALLLLFSSAPPRGIRLQVEEGEVLGEETAWWKEGRPWIPAARQDDSVRKKVDDLIIMMKLRIIFCTITK